MVYLNNNLGTQSAPTSFPEGALDTRYVRFAAPLQANGNLTYLEFIAVVKRLWEEGHPQIPILPLSINRDTSVTYTESSSTTKTYDAITGWPEADASTKGTDTSVRELSSMPTTNTVNKLDEFPAIIGYSMELRKTHSTEPKPKMRQIPSDRNITVYGQRFQNIVAFTVMSKVGLFQGADGSQNTREDLDAAVLCDQIIEAFEDFMMEYTPVFKLLGASELVYSRRLSDSEINRDNKDIHKRVVTYMLTTEKTFATTHSKIESIALDVRTWMAYEKGMIARNQATPNYENTPSSIIDLYQTATPNA